MIEKTAERILQIKSKQILDFWLKITTQRFKI